jgi:hypothetical protein
MVNKDQPCRAQAQSRSYYYLLLEVACLSRHYLRDK